MRPDGTVKVLDFGLAKAIDGPAGAARTTSPTVTRADLTRQGAMLGTVGLHEPRTDQRAAGHKRSDIWAFGCVVFEMLTGRAPFDGRTASEILANVLKSRAGLAAAAGRDARARSAAAPPRAGQGRPASDWHDIVDARLEIDDVPAAA